MNGLLQSAEKRLVAVPAPSQRYGLSVMLRKAYPQPGHGPWAMGHGAALTVRGAEAETRAWENVPAEIQGLVRKRVAEDTLFASHVLRSEHIQTIEVAGERTLTLQRLITTGTSVTVLIDVAPESILTIREESPDTVLVHENRFSSTEGPSASSLVLLRIGAGAHVRWFSQLVGNRGCTVMERLVLLDQDAMLEQYSTIVGPDILRENIHVVLAASGATVRTHTLFAGAKDHQFDIGITAEHRAPHTVSNLRAKGVLSGKAQAVVRGLVRVEREAPGSDGYQRCDALLLSPTAEVDPVPNLEINTNDVRCTHGVTVTHVNPEHMFYLQSRGMDGHSARQLLVEGFADGMLQPYPEEQRDALRAAVRRTLQEHA